MYKNIIVKKVKKKNSHRGQTVPMGQIDLKI